MLHADIPYFKPHNLLPQLILETVSNKYLPTRCCRQILASLWWQSWSHGDSVISNFCDPMDCSLPGSSVHGILQARILEWIVMLSSRGSFWPRDWTHPSCISGRFLHCMWVYALTQIGCVSLLKVPRKFLLHRPVWVIWATWFSLNAWLEKWIWLTKDEENSGILKSSNLHLSLKVWLDT